MKFKSKIDWWLAIIVWVPIMISWSIFLESFNWLLFTGSAALTGFIALFWFGTYYVIQKDTLIVSMGLTRKKIPIERIISIHTSQSMVSSAALSLDRLEINYRETDIFPNVVYVSPKDKVRFAAMLREKNPKIALDEKLTALVE